ncbi:hypothetical protein WICPIJ_010121 [Wickerhamomyces pijperi]|uniref:MSP domain-containing protein n=1 Tax=Wickerhamomyces pijperi TaxID=599730 RepID=A0A9P8PHG3_WICPI|nr:hypothetical protein WICPIJ_010121 [Wickerhamomyces pijperi]
MNISLSPSLLEFKPPFHTTNTEILTITNDSEETAAFKVKTTAPKLYCVRPNAGLVQPGQSVEVSIIMLGLKEEPTADYKCNDKFLIVALPCPIDLGEKTVSESWSEIESKFKSQSISKKIKVKYLVAEPEAINEQPTSGYSAIGEDATNTLNNRSTTGDEQAKTLSEKFDEVSAEDKSKIDALNEKLDSTASAPTTKTAAPTQSSSSMTNLILIALIVLIISWLLF